MDSVKNTYVKAEEVGRKLNASSYTISTEKSGLQIKLRIFICRITSEEPLHSHEWGLSALLWDMNVTMVWSDWQ